MDRLTNSHHLAWPLHVRSAGHCDPRTSTPTPLRTLVIGAGAAGRRFIQALRFGECQQRYAIAGIADVDPDRLTDFPSTMPTYTSLEAALAQVQPDAAVVCVNEEFHASVLGTVLQAPTIWQIITEKPLTQTLNQLQSLMPQLRQLPVSVNFCERYSPIITDCREWLDQQEAVLTRIEFWWGKYRVRDTRRTMGVLSELSHPLDLARFLLRARVETPLQILHCAITRSDYTTFQRSTADSITLTALLGQCVVTGASSFLWEQRRRRVVAYAHVPSTATTYQLVLEFDDPVWDNDSLTVSEVDPDDGGRRPVLQTSYRATDLPEPVRHVAKIHRFLLEVADPTARASHDRRYADLQDALWVQQVLDDLDHQELNAGPCPPVTLFPPRRADTVEPAETKGAPR